MAAPPLVFEFIGIVFTAILYGSYCLIFGLYWQIQLKRTDRWNVVLLYPLTASFILCTAYFIILIIQVQFLITMLVLNENSLESAILSMTNANNALYVVIDFISQLILLYRCWTMWHRPLVMVIPCILSLAFLGTALSVLVSQIKNVTSNLPLSNQFTVSSAVTAFLFLSLVVNILVTALIVYKIISVYHGIRGFNTNNVQASIHGNRQRNLYPVISILIETGLITFVGQLTQPIIYNSAIAELPLVAGWVVMLYGISTAVVLVRVEMGVSYDQSTTREASSTNLRRPIQLAPFASNLNQTNVQDVAALDDENDTLIRPN